MRTLTIQIDVLIYVGMQYAEMGIYRQELKSVMPEFPIATRLQMHVEPHVKILGAETER